MSIRAVVSCALLGLSVVDTTTQISIDHSKQCVVFLLLLGKSFVRSPRTRRAAIHRWVQMTIALRLQFNKILFGEYVCGGQRKAMCARLRAGARQRAGTEAIPARKSLSLGNNE